MHSRTGPMERIGRIQPCKANERTWTKPPCQPAQPGIPEILSIMHQPTRGKDDQHACTQS